MAAADRFILFSLNWLNVSGQDQFLSETVDFSARTNNLQFTESFGLFMQKYTRYIIWPLPIFFFNRLIKYNELGPLTQNCSTFTLQEKNEKNFKKSKKNQVMETFSAKK